MPEREFAWWRRFDEVQPLDPTADLLRGIATLTATLLQLKGVEASANQFLPFRLREPDG